VDLVAASVAAVLVVETAAEVATEVGLAVVAAVWEAVVGPEALAVDEARPMVLRGSMVRDDTVSLLDGPRLVFPLHATTVAARSLRIYLYCSK
jgi:hypothetical protein